MTATVIDKKKRYQIFRDATTRHGWYLFQDVSGQRSCLVGRKDLWILKGVTTAVSRNLGQQNFKVRHPRCVSQIKLNCRHLKVNT
jgi:hypothetical protein